MFADNLLNYFYEGLLSACKVSEGLLSANLHVKDFDNL